VIATHERDVANRFDSVHERFKSSVEVDDPRLTAVIQGLGYVNDQHIIDVGCGKGRFADRLVELGNRVVGLDISAAMLSAAMISERVLGTCRRLPFGANQFDAAIAIEVFEHVEPRSWLRVVDELHRVIRPGGRLIIVDKSAISLDWNRPWLPALAVKWIDQRRGRWMYPACSPIRERWFWPGQIERYLEQAGFEAIASKPISMGSESHSVFRAFPRLRRFVAWTATVAEGRPS
jgi:ubiquinone/menaquinone biosynthesis C-methylase UbiE